MAKECLYCGLQFADTTTFCPNCGRPTESGFSIRPMQESELDRLRREVQEKDEQVRQLVLTRTQRGEASRAVARSTDRRSLCDGSDGRRRAQRCCPLGGVEGRGRRWIDPPNRSENQEMQALHHHETPSLLTAIET